MKPTTRRLIKKAVAIATLVCMTVTQSAFASPLILANVPLFIGANVPPQVMLDISKDQQLFKKAYNDYSDLDGDGRIETTYKHSIDYYGYFDSTKCYNYNTTTQRFEPAFVSGDKYCNGSTWSGNFLNWVSMSRIDTVRKLLYGGTRSTDTSSVTVLQRAYLPTDAHAWAKYYAGTVDPVTGQNDINKLTPFSPPTSTFSFLALSIDASSSFSYFTIPVQPAYTPPLPLTPANALLGLSTNPKTDFIDLPLHFSLVSLMSVGDQIKFESYFNPGNFLIGAVLGFSNGGKTVRVQVGNIASGAGITDIVWRITNLSRTGISFCSLTKGGGGANDFSQTNSNPPLIRVAQGNFHLWSASEVWQCQWSEEHSNTQGQFNNGNNSNGNIASLSSDPNNLQFNASSENPSQSVHALGTGLAQGEYVARVQACVTGLFGGERCKQYPNGNYKPIGLLQEYGDVDLIQFGLMTGSFRRNLSGGVLRKNIGTFTNEVNVMTDGTFTTPASPPGSPRSTTSAATPAGIVNTLNYMRVWGYQYSTGSYADNCIAQLTTFTENNCTSWGNPMSEIYYESLRYFAGQATTLYSFTNKGSKDNQLGLPLPTWTDPLSAANYCAPLNVVAFNASVSSYDDTLRNTVASDIGSTQSTGQLATSVGDAEGITGNSYFIGKLIGATPTSPASPTYKLCTAKTITGLGDASGICPEGPTLSGSYLMPGLAYFAKTNRIRNLIGVPGSDTKSLKVTTYGIQLATNTPQLVIPVPGSTTGQKVVIQPIYRVNVPAGFTLGGQVICPSGGPTCVGGGTLVDLKFVNPPQTDPATGISTGKVYVNWEDSEQGSDFDQDVWGTLEWSLDPVAGTITITTNTVSAATVNPQGFGYTISGTKQDGPHFHSGIFGFNYTDPVPGVLGCTNCQVSSAASGQRGPRSQTYQLGATTAGILQDPLWYAAKYGAFVDGNNNNLPDQQSEWDTRLASGKQGSDGVPDTYFLVTNPLGLVSALDRAFVSILSNASASSVATNSTSLQTGTTIYQARFNANDWSGQVLAFAVDVTGTIAQKPTWDAGLILNDQDPASAVAPATTTANTTPAAIRSAGRSVITFNGDPGVRAGVPFRWPANPASPQPTEISATLVTDLNISPTTSSSDGLGQQRLAYLRGDRTLETNSVTGFRARPVSVLGDIVNSNPAFVAAPNAGFGDSAYVQFRLDNIGRTSMIYVGANDGMLHAFRADDGRELLAYVPSKVHSKLNVLTDKTYVGNQHRYYVDGSPEVGDAFIHVGATNQWRTVLVSGLGAGGQGLFALDVTRPDQFSEANAANIVLWEFNEEDDPDLGYVYSQPAIRKMANGRWAAIIAGGYNNSAPVATGEIACTDSAARQPAGCTTSSTGSAYLYIIYLDGPTGPNRTWQEGTDYIKIRAQQVASDTPGTPNGLAQPLAADVDADGFVDFIYAGDLRGNLWKFDVRLPSPLPNTSVPANSRWTSTSNQAVLFTATSPNNPSAGQPITSKPDATLHPMGQGFIITFGTGKYLEPTDPYPPASGVYDVQSFYGIWDKNDAAPISGQTVVTSRNQLLEHDIALGSGGVGTFRVIVPVSGQPDQPDWSTDTTPPAADDSPPKHMGWFLDFPNSGATGERSVFRPILNAGRLIFSTLLPLTQTCQFGGTSFTMVIDPTTGGRIDAPVLDINANQTLNYTDTVSYGGQQVYASGVQSTIGITPTPTIIKTGSLPPSTSTTGGQILGTSGPLVASSSILLAYALSAGSSGGNASTMIGLSAAGGRVSWRELLSD